MTYDRAIEHHDLARIDKLNELCDVEHFWDDVRKLTARVRSDHALGRWECLAEYRFNEINGVTIVCYNTEEFWLDRKAAMRYYAEGVLSCDGCESDRYAHVLSDLAMGKTYCTDGVSTEIRRQLGVRG